MTRRLPDVAVDAARAVLLRDVRGGSRLRIERLPGLGTVARGAMVRPVCRAIGCGGCLGLVVRRVGVDVLPIRPRYLRVGARRNSVEGA
jgi:hypothetical protein